MRISVWVAISLGLLTLTSGCSSEKKKVRIVAFGEKAEVGPFVYQGFETKWPMNLKDPGGKDAEGKPKETERTAKDRFLIISLSVLNSGTVDSTIPSFELVDDQDNSYPEQMDGTGVEKWLGLSRKLRSAESDQGAIVFDVPPKHYRLRVADEADNFIYVDVPFNLMTENPASQNLQ